MEERKLAMELACQIVRDRKEMVENIIDLIDLAERIYQFLTKTG